MSLSDEKKVQFLIYDRDNVESWVDFLGRIRKICGQLSFLFVFHSFYFCLENFIDKC